ncbi:MAG TPA: glycosyltransferase [Acetobacteraceae bacterium]
MHVFPSFVVGGAQARFTALANHFGAAFRHLIVSLDGNLSCRERLRADLDVSFLALPAAKHAMLGNVLRFHRLLRQWRPAMLVTCNWGAIEFALANLLPVARHLHVVDGFGPEERDAQLPRRVLVRRLALSRTTVVVPSRTLLRIATDTWKLDPRRVRYVPNGVDLARFQPAGARAQGNEVPVIGTVAALRPEKNLARLLRAFARIADTHPARLVIVGDGGERQALLALAASLGIAERVTFTGHRDDTPALYAGFDIFALSSDTEQMPLSVLEAMASGLPVVSTDVGDVRSMVAEQNGPLVAGADEAVLAGALAALLSDPVRRAAVGAANLAKARRDFDQAAMFAAWRALWAGTAAPR